MKWLVASLAGATWAVLVTALSLAFGTALPISLLGMGLTAEAAQLRIVAGWVLIAYATVCLMALVRMHYRPPVVRR